MTTTTLTPLRTVELPAAPLTASPAPLLTSIHSTPKRGPWGDSKYPGNCGGHLILDLLTYFKPRSVCDPMTGSGTCRDVCEDLGIPCSSFDVRSGFDASDPACFAELPEFDFIWLHPPYWRMKIYSDDPRCLSNAPTVEDFCDRLERVIANCMTVLSPNGKIAILMGDFYDKETRRYQPLTYLTKKVCLELGLWPACTDIIRFQHGNTSSKKQYRSSFIPGLHDTLSVFKRD